MKKSKAKASGAVERDLVFGFRAGQHRCELTVPLQFPVEGDVSDLHGRLMLLHKSPCFMEDGESGDGGRDRVKRTALKPRRSQRDPSDLLLVLV